MKVNAYAKYLNVSRSEFTNDKGEVIEFYRLSCLPAPEYDPITLPCVKEVSALPSSLALEKFADVVLELEVYETRTGGVKVRVTDVAGA